MLGELLDRPHPRVGDARLIEALHDLGGVEVAEDRLDLRIEGRAVRQAQRVGREPRVRRERRPPQHLVAERPPLALVLDAEVHHVAVAPRERPVGGDDRVPGPRAEGRGAPVRVVQGIAHPLAERLEHRHLDHRALAGALPHQERGEDARVGVHAGRDVRDGDAHLGGLVRGAGDRQHPRLGLHQQVVGLAVAVGAGRAVPRDLAHHEPRVRGPQLGRRQPEPPGGAGGEVLDEDVGLLEQPPQHDAGVGVLHVEGQRLLRPVQPHEVRREPPRRRVVAPREVAHPGPLDLDDAGPEVGELAGGERRRHRLLERQDRDPLERSHQHDSIADSIFSGSLRTVTPSSGRLGTAGAGPPRQRSSRPAARASSGRIGTTRATTGARARRPAPARASSRRIRTTAAGPARAGRCRTG